MSNFEGFDLPPLPANPDWYRPVGPLPKQAPEYQTGQIDLPYDQTQTPLRLVKAPPALPAPLPATAAQMAQVIQLLREISGVLADVRVNTNRIGR